MRVAEFFHFEGCSRSVENLPPRWVQRKSSKVFKHKIWYSRHKLGIVIALTKGLEKLPPNLPKLETAIFYCFLWTFIEVGFVSFQSD
jgi:hypothetical protein